MADPTRPVRVLAFCGSLRAKSFNRALLRAALELAPPELAITPWDSLDLPLFNADVEAKGDPASVAAFKQAVGAADALLIATPEYNHGITGVLKNAIDWASRPAATAPIKGKPVALMGASTGINGTVRAQLQARQVLASIGCPVLLGADVFVRNAASAIDAEGRLADEPGRQALARMLAAFVPWARRFMTA